MSSALAHEKQNLERAANELLSSAMKSGADAAEVCGSFAQKTKLTLEKQDYQMASADEGYQLGLRVLRQGRQGFASCNSTASEELKEISARAVAIADLSPKNPNYRILASADVLPEAPGELWDDGLFHLSMPTQKDWTQGMFEEATRDPRFRLNDGSVEVSSGLYLILNSQGTAKFERETAASWSLTGMGVDGDTITSFDYFGDISRTQSQTVERILRSTRVFRNQVLINLNQGPAETYRGVVVFSPRAVCEIFLSSLAYHFNGRVIAEKTGRWNLDKIGELILNQSLTLRDLPWRRDLAGCAAFDREGTPTRNLDLLAQGRMGQILLDHYSAHLLGLSSTGNAAGGPSGPPSVSARALCLDPGTESKSDLYRRVENHQKKFLLVHRFSGEVDPVTGDFSGVAKGGEWWQGGEYAHCIKETMISGNLFESLGNSLFGISAETEIVGAAEISPTLAVDSVSVTTS